MKPCSDDPLAALTLLAGRQVGHSMIRPVKKTFFSNPQMLSFDKNKTETETETV